MAASIPSGVAAFDLVEVTVGTQLKSFSYEEFMGMALAERIRLILSGKPQFFRGGETIPRTEALSLAT